MNLWPYPFSYSYFFKTKKSISRSYFYMHDHSGKVKHTKTTDDIQANPYQRYINKTDVTEEFLVKLEAESACEK